MGAEGSVELFKEDGRFDGQKQLVSANGLISTGKLNDK